MVVASSLQDMGLALGDKVSNNTLRKSELQSFCTSLQEGAALLQRNVGTAAELIAHFKQVAVDRTSASRRSFDLRHIVDEYGNAHFPAPHEFDNAVWVGYRLSEVLPLKLSIKQNLLEMNDSVSRLRILAEFLKKQIN